MENFVLKAKSTMKRIAAISAGALMMGATVFGAAAAADYTLADYPAPFVTDGQWVGLIIVGADAASADVAGGIGVAATLAQVATSVEGVTTTVTGGLTEDVALAGNITAAFGSPLDDTDLGTLQDTTLDVEDEDLDIHEEITLAAVNPPYIGISSLDDNDYGADPVVEFASDSVEYTYVFDEVPTGNWTVIDDDDPLEINFLGAELTITNIENEAVTAQIGTEFYLQVGDSVTVEGSSVELLDLNELGAIVVSVDGFEEIVTGTEDVGPLEIEVKDWFYSDVTSDRAAVLVIGTDASKEYNSGDEFYVPCATRASEDCDEDEPDWEWVIEMNGVAEDELGVTFSESWTDDDDPVLLEGETFYLPNDFAYIEFSDLVVDDFAEYRIYFDDDYNLEDVGSTADESVIVIEAVGQEDEGLIINGADTSEVVLWFDGTTTVWAYYVDDNNDVLNSTLKDAAILVDIEYGDTKDRIEIQVDGSDDITVDVENDNGDDLTLDVSYTTMITGFGDAEEAEGTDVLFGVTEVGEYDMPLLFTYGIIMDTPEDTLDNDEVVLHVPSDTQEATIIIGTAGTTVTTAGGAGTTLGGVPVAKLDTEVTDKTAYHMILVGGSAVNRLTAEAMGLTYPTYGAASGIPMDKGMLKLIEDAFAPGKVALVVAGWEAANTRDASEVLQDYQSYALTGNEMEVTSAAGVISVGPLTVA